MELVLVMSNALDSRYWPAEWVQLVLVMRNALDSRYWSVEWVQFLVVWGRLRYFFLLVTR